MNRKNPADKICREASVLPGRIGLYYTDIFSGEHWGLHEEERFEAASVIKLPVFAAIEMLVTKGLLSWEERLQCYEEDKLPSCGALQFMTGEPELDIRTLCAWMITISDNSATNLLIRRIGMPCLNAVFEEIGLHGTKLERLLFDAEAAAKGLENRFVPAEIGGLLGRIARRDFISPAVSEEMEALLRRQQIRHKLQGYLPRGTAVAHKTGEDAGITNDVGIIFAKEPFVLCFASNGTDVPAAERFLRQAALELYEACGGAA